mmetsp:Transcript_76219/g.246638  ORF Transcript_76219/g.246638 Transcript_76219/m.246638 type:complete len:163 (+) Transcript_76219:139-627(+)
MHMVMLGPGARCCCAEHVSLCRPSMPCTCDIRGGIYYEIGMFFLDMLSDLNSGRLYVLQGHPFFAGISLGVFLASSVKHGRTCLRMRDAVQASVKKGFWEEGLLSTLRDEVKFEGVAGLMLNVYGLPFAVSGWTSLASQLFTLALGIRGVMRLYSEQQLGVK